MAYNTVVVKGYPMRKEAVASAGITPGHLIDLASTNKVAVHAVAGGNTARAFAIENEVIGNGIDVAYIANDNVLYGIFQPGDEVYALVAAAASAIVIGDEVESAGDGTVRKATAFAQSGTTPFAVTAAGTVIGRALQAVDNSAGGTAVRLLIEII